MKVNCPYCEQPYIDDDVHLGDGDEEIFGCKHCEKVFHVIASVEITYEASEIEEDEEQPT